MTGGALWSSSCAVLTGAATLLVRPGLGAVVLARVPGLVSHPARPWWQTARIRASRHGGRGAVVLVASLLVLAVVAGVPLPALLDAVALAVVAVVGWTIRAHRRAERRRAEVSAQVADAWQALSADLQAGLPGVAALAHAADGVDVLRPAVAAARSSGHVAAALRDAAGVPGAGSLSSLASGWEVAERTGAPLADLVQRLAEAEREERETAREVDAGLAPARATARLMAVLPVLGLALGRGMGADPWHVLTHTLVGSLCLLAGVGLASAGVLWVEAIARRAAR